MAHINLLDPLLSQRIAAGEVIERPSSILRELLDNAIDAGADEIRTSIDGGGIDRLSVSDNGSGITREDLAILGNRHATSKIHDPDDLYTIHTLGFRGEALYSIGAVTKLTVATHSAETGEASTLVIDNGRRHDIAEGGPGKGTAVTTEDLFLDIPARRAFLKRSSTEASMCRSMLVSKALAFPGIRFTFSSDGALRLDWPKAESLKERVMMLYRSEGIADADVYSLHTESEDFSIDIIAGNQAIKRSDRKEIRIYVNGRAVEEYSLQQAVTYGYGELLPGGSYPYAVVFINDSPELVDFNIHPAKREVKIRNKAEIHHAIVTLIQNGVKRQIPEIAPIQKEFYLEERKEAVRTEQGSTVPSFTRHTSSRPLSEPVIPYAEKDKAWLEKAKALIEERERGKKAEVLKRKVQEEEKGKDSDEPCFRYIGQAFHLFLIAEKDHDLYLVDQHAAHERILYDDLLAKRTVQPLLVPIRIEVDDLADEFIGRNTEVYESLGIKLEKRGKGVWEVTEMPASCRSLESEITDFIQSARADGQELESRLFAVIACKAAIKAGDDIDRWSAEEILKKVFSMKEPACPHGRTFLMKISEKELRLLAGRTG